MQIKISDRSHSIIEQERTRLRLELGRRVTQAEVVERALVVVEAMQAERAAMGRPADD